MYWVHLKIENNNLITRKTTTETTTTTYMPDVYIKISVNM